MESLPERPQSASHGSPLPAHPSPDASLRRRRDDLDETGSASSRRSRDHTSSRDDAGRERDHRRSDRDGDSSRSDRARSQRGSDDGRESKRRRSRSRDRLEDRIGGRDRDNRDYDRGGRRYRDERDYDYDNRSSRRYRDEYDYPPRDHRQGGRRDRDRHDRHGSGTPHPPRDEPRARSPQLTEEEREMRSVFVSQLSARVTDRELGIFFEHGAGRVRDARVIVDRISKRSKGVGYVEFVELESVAKALAMSETKLLGIPIIVQYTEAEKNRQARVGAGTVPPPTGPDGDSGIYRLYVGSLNFALTEHDIRQVFQPFGEVTLVDLHKDPVTSKSKGYAFVQFKDSKDAMTALEKMNNFPLAGREIRVGLVSDRSQNPAFLDAARAQVAGAYVPGQQGIGIGGGPFQQGQREQPLAVDDGSGGTLSSISRLELMQKLARTDKPADLPDPSTFRPNIPLATTRNVLMKNAFDPAEETERDWDTELRDDVKGEVEDKYGKVADIFVLKDSQGEIYIRFVDVPSAMKAVAGLNGRWFGGKQIEASHLPDVMFDARRV